MIINETPPRAPALHAPSSLRSRLGESCALLGGHRVSGWAIGPVRRPEAMDGYFFRALDLGCPSDASLARAQWRKNGFVKKGALTLAFSVPVSCLSFLPLPGSSVAEQVTVNHLVAGSIPARAAISSIWQEVTLHAGG